MPDIALTINGRTHRVPAGISVAAALLSAGETTFRKSVSGQPRGPLCGMGICFECRVTIDGRAHCRSCQVTASKGMAIQSA